MFPDNYEYEKNSKRGTLLLDQFWRPTVCPISMSMLMWELDVTLKNQRDYRSPAQWRCQVLPFLASHTQPTTCYMMKIS